MSDNYVTVGDIRIHPLLHQLVAKEIAPNTGVAPAHFWEAMGRLVRDFAPRNEALLRKRDAIQALVDNYILEHAGQEWDAGAYTAFLSQIGYIVPVGPRFEVDTTNVDDAISITPGPQLVVPVDNARYALNAANARWGSLLDAFYGTNAGPPETNGAEKGKSYNPVRGARVFEYVHKFLDTYFPLKQGSHNDATAYKVQEKNLSVKLNNGATTLLRDSAKFVGYNLNPEGVAKDILLKNNGLHVHLVIDRSSSVGKAHSAGVKDVLLESAVSAICDCEDSVAAVDAEDKCQVYRNWTGLMKGTLEERFTKGGKTVTRKLARDKTFVSPSKALPYPAQVNLPGRACLLVRNVGMHLMTDMILDKAGRQVPEGLIDAMITALAALHDLKPGSSKKPLDLLNSRSGSMYIVKPKLHGPEEVAFTVELFERVEQELGMPNNSIKMGIMDEERRTTVNLYECIRQAKNRCIFINTGFLDRTGDEIHTSFYAGPMCLKADIKTAPWRVAYEHWNVDVGLAVGLVGKGQIGKGMWAQPDEMAKMVQEKGGHPKSGATTAWVPSPTAATLHALHYHETNVLNVQRRLQQQGSRAKLADILLPPLLSLKSGALPTKEQIVAETENNAQGILGYVVRWVQSGVGCSKVPNTQNVGLMEDRATLRIASQHIANWLYHGLLTEEDMRAIFKKMAVVVDRQNEGTRGYRPMAPSYSGNGFRCAIEMVTDGLRCPNGLTEHTLTRFRRMEKSMPKAKL